MRSLWFTAYQVSCLTFLALAYIEWQVPGFVSFVFPLYWILVLAIVTGVGTLVASKQAHVSPRATELVALSIGILFSLLVFHAADSFGAYRLVLAILVLLLPPLLLKALSDVKD